MTAQELKKGIWYKFFPYIDKPLEVWYFKPSEDAGLKNTTYIDGFKQYHSLTGSFSDYSEINEGYTLATAEEINPYLPEHEQISSNYSIY